MVKTGTTGMNEGYEQKTPRYGPRLNINYAELMKNGYSIDIECKTIDEIRESISSDDEDSVVDMLNEEKFLSLTFILSDESEAAA